MNNGGLGEKMAQALWPELQLTENGSELDKNGIDGYLNGETVQIKYDKTITKTGNIYHEIYEKSKGHPEQDWRASPHNIRQYIFCTDGFAIRVRTSELAGAEQNMKLTKILDTSMGFLIPIGTVKAEIRKVK